MNTRLRGISSWRLCGISVAVLALAGMALTAAAASGESDAAKAARLERELAELKGRIGIIATMEGVPLEELKAVAGIITPEMRGLTIDLSGVSGEYCLRDPSQGRFMVHFSQKPAGTSEDVLYFVAADSLTGAGLDVAKLPLLPELGKMQPGTWYHYDGKADEPHHKRRLGQPYLVLALNIR